MCSTSINRRNILRQVRSGEITGTGLLDCAICLVARLKLHHCCSRKMFEKLVELERDYYIELHDAVLLIIPAKRRRELLKAREEEARRKQRTRLRTAAHRFHGIRGLPVLPVEVPEDPEWDPDEPSLEDVETEAWALRTHTSTPPAGGWGDDDVAELSQLLASQRADMDADEQRRPIKGCQGSLDDLLYAGIDERQLVY